MSAGRADPLSSTLEDVVVRFGAMMRRVGARHGLVGADADELLQEVRIRLWRSGGSRERIEGLGASYVYRTAVSAAVDLIRQRRRGPAVVQEERTVSERAVEPRHAPDRALEGRELGAAVEAALRQLAEARRVTVRLHLAGYEREEIAALLGWSEAKTRNLLYRGLNDLRGVLGARGIGPE